MSSDTSKSLAQQYAEGIFPIISKRSDKFPGGESLDDLEKRATQAIEEIVMPFIWKAAREGKKGVQIALVSHGLCISEVRSRTASDKLVANVMTADTCPLTKRCNGGTYF